MKRALSTTLAVLCLLGAQAQRRYESDDEKRQEEKQKKAKETMRKDVYTAPLVTDPDDYILPGSKTDRTLPERLQPVHMFKRLDCVFLKPEQITPSRHQVSGYGITAMENVGEETHVTYTLFVFDVGQWHALSKNKVMIDLNTGDRYFPRRVLNYIPFDKVLIIQGFKNRYIDFTVVYPKLSDSAEMVSFTDICPIQTELPLNRSPRSGPKIVNAKAMLEKSKNKPKDIF